MVLFGFSFLNFWIFLVVVIFVILVFLFGFFGFLKRFLEFCSKVLLKVTAVATEHQKLPKVSQNSVKSFFLPEEQ